MLRIDKKPYLSMCVCVRAQVDFLYQFWKLRRKANCNRPLVTLKRDEVDNLAQQEQDVLYRRLNLFTHLRQDLERVSLRTPGRGGVCVCVWPRRGHNWVCSHDTYRSQAKLWHGPAVWKSNLNNCFSLI